MRKTHRGRKAKIIVVNLEQKQELERLARRAQVNRSVSFRARIILLSSEGLSVKDIARQVRANVQTIYKWQRRFRATGVNALYNERKPGAPRKISDDKIEAVVVKTLQSRPQGATHWSTRMMAKKVNLSQSAISRIWRTFGLKPHRASTYTLSQDPLFVEKVSTSSHQPVRICKSSCPPTDEVFSSHAEH